MKLCYLLFNLLVVNTVFAATYRNYVAHSVNGNTYSIWVNSNTVPGEDVIGQICYTPLGGGPTSYTGFHIGTYILNMPIGANWRVDITVPTGASNLMLELANENQSNQQYGWTGCNLALSNVLAVKLLSFEAKSNSEAINLKWVTAQEQNNAYFMVERAANGLDFFPIAQIKGHGTTTEGFSYSFTDAQPIGGDNYYRLKDVDTQGKADYSKVIAANFNLNHTLLRLSPNPAFHELKINFNAAQQGLLPFQIFNSAGKLVLSQTQSIDKGDNQFKMNLSDLPQGLYYLRVNGEAVPLIKF